MIVINSLISIIVPVYNVEEYLSRCVNSILNQTYRDFELLLINDGSTDNSGAICEDFSKRDPRIKVIHKENGGLSDARNIGIDSAQGKFFLFVDSDDFIHPNMLELLVSNIIETDSDISVCSFQKVYSEKDCEIDYQNNIETCTNLEALDKFFGSNDGVNVVTWNKLYKAELFNGIQFPKGRLHEDNFTTFKLLYRCRKVVYSNAKMYYYFQRNNSITGAKKSKNYLDAIDANREMCDFFIKEGLFELAKKAISTYLWYLSHAYYQIKNLEKEIAKNVLKRFRSDFLIYWPYVSFSKSIMLLFLFYFSPKFYKFLSKIQHMISRLLKD